MKPSSALQMLLVAALILIAVVGLCQVTGLARKILPAKPTSTATPTPLPTATPLPTLTLTPTLAPTATPTPAPQIATGGTVVVQGTGGEKLRMRAAPGISFDLVASLDDGTRLKVLEGPQTADGYTWWRLQTSAGTVGWAAADWLAPVAP
jgi:hypothetical protein